MKVFIFSLIVFIYNPSFSQGHIDHIKNQPYLESRGVVDCDHMDGDNMSSRICANLAFQKSDSLLVIVYIKLLAKAKRLGGNKLKQKIITMQTAWRSFRDRQCDALTEDDDGAGTGSPAAIQYMDCLKQLTYVRIGELKKMLNQFGKY